MFKVVAIGKKIREIRRSQHLSLREVAEKAEVSISHLSQVESGKTNPSVSSLARIANALSVPFDSFFSDEETDETQVSGNHQGDQAGEDHATTQGRNPAEYTSPKRKRHRSVDFIVHPDTRATIHLMGGVTWARLTAESEEGIEFREVCYEVGLDSGPLMHYHAGREFGMILQGQGLLEVGFERYEVHVEDSFCFDSTIPHRLTNTGQEPLRAIWVTFDH
jgi:transcriptional regulator with XRE-family HTH domain